MFEMIFGAVCVIVGVILGGSIASVGRDTRSKDSYPPSDPPEGRPKVDGVFK